jgi:hypothetical protein
MIEFTEEDRERCRQISRDLHVYEVDAAFLRELAERPAGDAGDAGLRGALREAVDAGRTLANYTQGFSENRIVAEAKESIERANAALADSTEF